MNGNERITIRYYHEVFHYKLMFEYSETISSRINRVVDRDFIPLI